MKIKVIAHYEADPSEGFEDNCGTVEVSSQETNMTFDELSDDFENLESETGITIYHGGDDDWYELDLPDYADGKGHAEQLAKQVFDEAMNDLDIDASSAKVFNVSQATDTVVCVQEVLDGSGDIPSIFFLNLTALETDTHKKCKKYAKAIRKAMTGDVKIYGSGPKMGETTEFAGDEITSYEVSLPCVVSDLVVLFVG